MKAQTVQTPNYDMHIQDLGDLFCARFEVDLPQPRTQFNVFGMRPRLIVVRETSTPILVRTPEGFQSLDAGDSIAVPPFSLVEWTLPGELFFLDTFCSRIPMTMLDADSLAFSFSSSRLPKGTDELEAILSSAKPKLRIGRTLDSPVLAQRAKSWIDSHFLEDCRIADVAKKLSCSREVMSRSFTAAYGLSLQEYRKYLRVGASLDKVMIEDAKISDAALASGYDNLGHFYRQFQRAYDAKPKQFGLVEAP